MKKILLFLVLFGGAIFLFLTQERNQESTSPVLSDKEQPSVHSSPTQSRVTESLFVPYWTLNADFPLDRYDELYYFGIATTADGIDKNEPGYARIERFMEKAGEHKKKFLVVRMVDQDLNNKILKDSSSQEHIAKEAVQIAKEYKFDGVLLDFETAKISFDATTNRVTSLHKVFDEELQKANLLYYVAVYGDTYYRVRAYDVAKIGNMADKIIVMAYDFHKSRGNPGPNFPLSGGDVYGYDFKRMISDFSNDVPKEKLQVTFGMFGYDWTTDDEGKSVSFADPLSSAQIHKLYIDSCEGKTCEWNRDNTSGETKVMYEDDEGVEHIIWFENQESVKRKIEYLKSQGITEYGYWAYSYF